ncbi:hypothetical protein [Pseudomonas asplenii]|uniref:hypothetical protein n=1 Tax=Pseudomonas asplenii TaxID=53407 RepID=UPI00036DF151|nr:hypothetical protein [Pseudomonas fuscovaginae]
MAVFNVNFAVDDMQGKTVLVFLKSLHLERNYLFHAWQVLDGVANSVESFSYEPIIETDVTTIGPGDKPIISPRRAVDPGTLLQAVTPGGLSLSLQPAPVSLAQMKLTPNQCGVINRTNPYLQLDCNWYVSGQPVVTIPHVDTNMTVSFEYLPYFYFMVAPPPRVGQTYIVQNFSDMAHYALPITATEVDVTLTRDSGLWRFDFQER